VHSSPIADSGVPKLGDPDCMSVFERNEPKTTGQPGRIVCTSAIPASASATCCASADGTDTGDIDYRATMYGSAAQAAARVTATQQYLAAKQITGILGILNGTTNVILTAMSEQGRGYAEALAWMLLVLTLVLTVFIFRSSPAWVYYEGEGRAEKTKSTRRPGLLGGARLSTQVSGAQGEPPDELHIPVRHACLHATAVNHSGHR